MILSIIVPIYNVEAYIRPCIQSILKQGLESKDYEVILVNDGTKDQSLEKIQDLLALNQNFYLYEQSNQGLSVARNKGIEMAHGDYLLFLDSDDLLVEGTLQSMLAYANDSEADMVVGDFLKLDNDAIAAYNPSPQIPVRDTLLLNGHDYFLHQLTPQQCYVWRTLYRSEFLNRNKIRFIPGLYFEDIPFTTECFLHATKCLKVSLPFYIYRQHKDSIVYTIDIKKLKHFNTIMVRLNEFKKEKNLPLDIQQKLDDNIFSTFSIAIWYLSHDKSLFIHQRDYIKDLKSKLPHLKFSNGFKQKAISFMFRYTPYTYIWLRSFYNQFFK